MLTSHELFGFMPHALSTQILEDTFAQDKELYRLTVNAVAEARKLRPVFFERKPRAERNNDLIAMLAKPRLDLIAGNVLRGWLMRKNKPMLTDFLNALGIAHKDGVVDELPATVEEGKLRAAVENLLNTFPPEEVSVYLNAFYAMNEISWPNLKHLLENEPRLQFGG
ncbi:MAG: hypothetical protein M3Y82_11195 [Verrucomicrobiota bacterium]|nr:hypothetical protein [Verrucomicrobiota bacterium]